MHSKLEQAALSRGSGFTWCWGADTNGVNWDQGAQDQDAMHLGCKPTQTPLPSNPSGAFPSPADYAALLHPDPAHTSQVELRHKPQMWQPCW
jgi:hypothetical protein